MARIPRDASVDSSLALLREGNTFISARCRRYGSDIFKTRLLLQNTLCLSGEEAARLFYDNNLFKREKAQPALLVKTLLGEGGIQGKDDETHRARKRLFMALLSDEASIAELTALTDEQWGAAIAQWSRQERVVLHQAVEEIHCRAVCRWAGVPLDESEVSQRCADLATMIDGSGGIGRRHWQARRARSRAETWIGGLVEQVRANTLAVAEDRALSRISGYREPDGQLLTPRVAAVEVLNLLRPTVAIARYVTFCALSLHERPEWYGRLQQDNAWLEPFVQEVRRYYTFFPFIAARVRKEFDWKGYRFPQETRVLLDLYGTNRDPRTWKEPDTFHPERYQESSINAFNFIPQGGGEHATHHRCPGEWFTIALMTVAVTQLTRAMTYTVPPQDLHIEWSRMPIIPESRFVIGPVRPV